MAGSQDIAEDPRNAAVLVWINGTLVPRAEARVSVFDGGFIAKGYDALLQSALHGKANMPAQGGGDFSDFEIGRAVVYMANQGGAKFDEPKEPAAAASAAASAASM